MPQFKSKIIFNKEIAPGHFHLGFEAPAIAREAKPGQFVHIRISGSFEPLLRRPFSVHRIRNQKPESAEPALARRRRAGAGGASPKGTRNQIEIMYKVIGKGTEILSQRKAGEFTDVIGPFGNGFNYQPIAHSQQPVILVAGGMGVAPLVFLAEKLAISHQPLAISNSIVLIGAKTKNHILCEKEFKKFGCDVKIATDDGSRGFKGRVTGLLKKILSSAISLPAHGFAVRRAGKAGHEPLAIYACGPHAMLKEVASIAFKHKIPCQVSLEEIFACGVGACLGCAVKVKPLSPQPSAISQYKLACKDGPVFDAGGIMW